MPKTPTKMGASGRWHRPKSSPPKTRPEARSTALEILNALDREKRTLDTLLADRKECIDALGGKDRALCHALVFGVLRWRGRLDWIIAQFSNTKIHKIQPGILNILRMGLFQILFMDKIPTSAAVNTAVEAAKRCAAPWVVKYVNAVLRSAARGHTEIDLPDIRENPAKAITIINSMPLWLVRRWLVRFGLDETMALCDAVNAIPPISLRVNSLKTDRAALMADLESDTGRVGPGRLCPDTVVIEAPRTPIQKMEAFKRGWFQVQDEAAQLVSRLVTPQPGETVLDACAGLGGKTGHLAQLMADQGTIWALDNNRRRLASLKEHLARLGVTMVRIRTVDVSRRLEAEQFPCFDRILLDAPCSGLGVLRRNPDAKWAFAKHRLDRFHRRQVALLTNLAPLVRVGGILVYTVCSFEPEENQASVNAFLKNQPEFAIVDRPEGLPKEATHLVDRKGYFRTFPHRDNMDGFFAVVLKRIHG
jgi:16S rRNA (cytosine967-C5)-methyltransferase